MKTVLSLPIAKHCSVYNNYDAKKLNLQQEENKMIKIYVCDDNSSFLKIIENKINVCILESRFDDFDYDIILFDNPKTAIRKINENQPDIIFLDIDMPEINGFNIAKKISENHKDTIIIFVTS